MKKNILSKLLAFTAICSVAAFPSYAMETGTFAEAPAEVSAVEIMPRATLYPGHDLSGNNSWRSTEFTASPSNGNYIRFAYTNYASESATVSLVRTDLSSEFTVRSMSVEGGGYDHRVCYGNTLSQGTYYLYIEASDGGTISGNIAAAQYRTNPD